METRKKYKDKNLDCMFINLVTYEQLFLHFSIDLNLKYNVLLLASFEYNTRFWLVFQDFLLNITIIECALYTNGPATCVKIW